MSVLIPMGSLSRSKEKKKKKALSTSEIFHQHCKTRSPMSHRGALQRLGREPGTVRLAGERSMHRPQQQQQRVLWLYLCQSHARPCVLGWRWRRAYASWKTWLSPPSPGARSGPASESWWTGTACLCSADTKRTQNDKTNVKLRHTSGDRVRRACTFLPACLSTMAPSRSLPGLAMVQLLTSCEGYGTAGASCTWRNTRVVRLTWHSDSNSQLKTFHRHALYYKHTTPRMESRDMRCPF